MRLNKWIGGVIIVFFFLFIDLSQQSETGERKNTVIRKKIRRRLDVVVPSSAEDEESSKSSEATIPKAAASTSDDILPKSTTFTEARKALFDRLNRPLQKEHDSTMSKLRSRLGMSSTEPPKKYYKKKVVVKKLPKSQTNDSMIIIPVPESQRKPYQPVIMQVTKSNESSTSAPETRVVTYKLNKMFVPMGIYGKVVQDEVTGPAPEIRHKGTASPLLKRKPKQEQHHQRIADTIDLTYNNPINYDQISITTDTTVVHDDHVSSGGGGGANDNNQRRRVGAQDQTRLTVPGPLKESTHPHGFLDTLRQTVSNIPGVFHKGLTSLTSLTSSFSENPFSDDTFTSASDTVSSSSSNNNNNNKRPPPVMASIPGGVIQPHNNKSNKNKKNPPGLSGYETLEYFRNRPHLFGRRLQGLDELTTSWKDYLFSRKSVPSPARRNFSLRDEDGMPPPPPFERRKSLDAQWKSITRKYTKTEIDEAKDRLFETFADPPSSAEIKALRTGAFEDLMQMFKLYLTPTGSSTSTTDEDTVTAAANDAAASSNEWMPISTTTNKKQHPPISFTKNGYGLSHHISTLSKNPHYSKQHYHPDEGYELVPSDVYFRQKNPNLEEIAAVVKPAGVSNELVKAVLPKEVANLDFYDYPHSHQQQPLTSLSDLTTLGGGGGGGGGSLLLQRNRDKAQQYKVKEETFMLPQKYYDTKYTSSSSEYHTTTTSTTRQPQRQPPMKVKDEEEPFMLPQKYYDINTPDNPTTRRPPPPQIFKESTRRISDEMSRIKFFAPIPISPATMLTSSGSGRRYSNPVPRYVVELAKKLQKDRDVQGIVRVSTKRANGPPIEYLYPVRG